MHIIMMIYLRTRVRSGDARGEAGRQESRVAESGEGSVRCAVDFHHHKLPWANDGDEA
jgi:hypothetical protein